jgi:site-specific DNA recombinase
VQERRYALYGRTSDEKSDRRLTIEHQQTLLRQWAERNTHTVVAEYWDDDTTGKRSLSERPAGNQLLSDARNGQFDAVVVAYIDRFGRTLLDSLQAAADLEAAGIGIVSVNEAINTMSDSSPLNFQLRALIAEEEHRRITERMQRGKLGVVSTYKTWPGGRVPLGYRITHDGTMVADPETAPHVQRVFEMRRDGASLNEIKEYLEDQGVKPGWRFHKRGNPAPYIHERHKDAVWKIGSISTMLRREYYLGIYKWNGVEIPCEQLISEELFYQVRKRRGKRVTKKSPEKGILSGLMTCTRCGRRYYSVNQGRKQRELVETRIYRCQGNAHPDPPNYERCGGKIFRVHLLDPVVWDAFDEHLSDKERMWSLLHSGVEEDGLPNTAEERIESLTRELEGIDDQIEEIWSEADLNNWPMKLITPRLNSLREREKQLRADLRSARTESAEAQDMSLLYKRLENAMERHEERRVEGFTDDYKYYILREFVERIDVETIGVGGKKQAHLEWVWRVSD